MSDDIIHTTCPCCGSSCYMIEQSDGNGGITPIFSHDIRWLCDYEEDALLNEQGSNVPNTYHGGE